MNKSPITVIAGFGNGLGHSLSKTFTNNGHLVAILARSSSKIEVIAKENSEALFPYSCDLTKPEQVSQVFDKIEKELGIPDCVIFNAALFQITSFLEIKVQDFEECWKISCFAGFLVAQQAVKKMLLKKSGTIIFTGATASLRGSKNFVTLASPKFALRALAQSLAREFSSKGIHVIHVIIDGQIQSKNTEHILDERGEHSLLNPYKIAEVYLQLHEQHRSTWTHEIDLRPWTETF
jgi:NAD(P)-dependent dehydrogenase (short-subunit alcohol dehydrogenase family)